MTTQTQLKRHLIRASVAAALPLLAILGFATPQAHAQTAAVRSEVTTVTSEGVTVVMVPDVTNDAVVPSDYAVGPVNSGARTTGTGTNAATSAVPDANVIATLLLNKVNNYRAANGVPRLSRSASVDAVARRWSSTMAARNVLSHNPNLKAQVCPTPKRCAENVAYATAGSSATSESVAQTLFSGWINSAPHRINLLSRTYTVAGMGAARSANGTVYTTLDMVNR